MHRHEFEWRREECYILRKPDPAVLVAVTKEQSGRLKTSSVQILDYNLNRCVQVLSLMYNIVLTNARFDINDRKGLEILILTALLTFQDTNEAYHNTTPSNEASTPVVSRPSFFGIGRRTSDAQGQDTPPTPPALPPKPAPRVGVQKIAEVHAVHAAQGEGEANEVEVGDDGTVEEYAEYAEGLLRVSRLALRSRLVTYTGAGRCDAVCDYPVSVFWSCTQGSPGGRAREASSS